MKSRKSKGVQFETLHTFSHLRIGDAPAFKQVHGRRPREHTVEDEPELEISPAAVRQTKRQASATVQVDAGPKKRARAEQASFPAPK